MKTIPGINRVKILFILLSFCALLNLLDCEIVTLFKSYPETLPFLERSPYTGPWFAFTVMLFVAALLAPLFFGRERISVGQRQRMTLRIYADFNSGGSPGHGACWLLRYGEPKRPLDEVAAQPQLFSGMAVTLFHEDSVEEFEVSAILEEHVEPNPWARWQALPDWRNYRNICGPE